MQLGLFENLPATAPFIYQSPTFSTDESFAPNNEPTLVSKAQRLTMQNNKFAHIFRGKTYAQIQEIHDTLSSHYYKKSSQSQKGAQDLSEWYSAMFAFETLALEQEYKRLDMRFCEIQEGKFYLIEVDGTEHKISFTFAF